MKVITAEISDNLFKKLISTVDKTGIININMAISMILTKALEDYLVESKE